MVLRPLPGGRAWYVGLSYWTFPMTPSILIQLISFQGGLQIFHFNVCHLSEHKVAKWTVRVGNVRSFVPYDLLRGKGEGFAGTGLLRGLRKREGFSLLAVARAPWCPEYKLYLFVTPCHSYVSYSSPSLFSATAVTQGEHWNPFCWSLFIWQMDDQDWIRVRSGSIWLKPDRHVRLRQVRHRLSEIL